MTTFVPVHGIVDGPSKPERVSLSPLPVKDKVVWRQDGVSGRYKDSTLENAVIKTAVEDANTSRNRFRATEGSSQISGNFASVAKAKDDAAVDKAGRPFSFNLRKGDVMPITTEGFGRMGNGNASKV
jgi:hypothetical protein